MKLSQLEIYDCFNEFAEKKSFTAILTIARTNDFMVFFFGWYAFVTTSVILWKINEILFDKLFVTQKFVIVTKSFLNWNYKCDKLNVVRKKKYLTFIHSTKTKTNTIPTNINLILIYDELLKCFLCLQCNENSKMCRSRVKS